MALARPRQGFTRVELLLVIAVVVAFIGLLLPALAKVREAGNRVACGNNLRRIGAALYQYQDTHHVLPPGQDQQFVGTLTYLLPFVGEDARFQHFSFDPAFDSWHDNRPGKNNAWNLPDPTGDPAVPPAPGGRYGAEGDLPVFLCPSAVPPPETSTALFKVEWAGPSWTYYFAHAPGRSVLGRSNYLPVGGECRDYPPYDRYKGLLGYRSSNSLTHVPDGTSTTLLVAEYAGAWINWDGSGGRPSGWSTGSWAGGFNYSCFGLSADLKPRDGGDGAYWSFGSRHPRGIIQAVWADGSVRAFPPTISFPLFLAISGFQDGVTVSQDN
jgi:type II secretory pathway pseudopilin PulG